MYALSKYLAGVFKNLCGKTEFTVWSSADFVKCISDLKVDDTEDMVSFDVKALYTSRPLTRTIDVVRKRLEKDDSWTHGTPLQSSHIVELLEL